MLAFRTATDIEQFIDSRPMSWEAREKILATWRIFVDDTKGMHPFSNEYQTAQRAMLLAVGIAIGHWEALNGNNQTQL